MKKAVLAAALLATLAWALTQTKNFSHIGTATGTYASPDVATRTWQALRHDLFIGGPTPLPYNANALWMTYTDHVYHYAYESYLIDNYAAVNGYDPEDFYTHMNVDYTHSKAYCCAAKFDQFEANSSGGNINGVFLYDGAGYADKTVAAWDSITNDVVMSATNTQLYLGYGRPFDRATFTVSTARVGGSVVFEYWNGTAWATLTVTDGTSQLSVSGTVNFTPPTDWAKVVVGAARSKWWIRARVATAPSTYPGMTSIKGDDWYTTGSNRGWSAAGGSRITCCTGGYQYDTAPPAGATARFRYQSRVRAFFTQATLDPFYFNHTKQAAGAYILRGYLSQRAIDLINAGGYGGLMYDDVHTVLTTSDITSPTDWLTAGHIDWSGDMLTAIKANYTAEVGLIHTSIPAAKIAGNCPACVDTATDMFTGDWVFEEDFCHLTIGDFTAKTTSTKYTFDDYLTANNPSNVLGVFVMHDDTNRDLYNTGTSTYAYWDKGNRRPIAALAFFYIHYNSNTYFYYRPWSISSSYTQTDEYYYFSSASASLTTQLNFANDATTKHIYATGAGADFTNWPSSGTRTIYFPSTGESMDYVKVSNTELTTTDTVYNTYSVGASAKYIETGYSHLSSQPIGQMFGWNSWLPAMSIDIGTPDPAGVGGGARLRDGTGETGPWKTAAQCGSESTYGVWRRDFTKAVVLLHPSYYNSTADAYTTTCSLGPFALGGTYYPLYADGTTGAGVTTINLKAGEGAILMKAVSTSSKKLQGPLRLLGPVKM